MTSGDICVSTCENPQTLSGTFHASITQQVWEPEEKPRLCPWPHSQLIHSSQWKSRQDVSSGPDPIHQLQRHQQTPSSPHPIFPLRTDHSKLLRHLGCLQISNTDECLGRGGGGRTPDPQTVLNTTQPTALSDVRQGCGGGAGKAAVGLPPRPGEDWVSWIQIQMV